jgi:DNA uptake protein ComE-like DNA-binding protein
MFSFFAVAIYKIVYSKLNVASRYKTSSLSRYAAESLVHYLQNELTGDNSKFQSLYALSQMNQRVIGDVTCQYTLSDESSRININNVYPSFDFLANLTGFDPGLAQSVYSSGFKPFEVKEKLLLVDGIDQAKLAGINDLITVFGNGKININTADKEVLNSLGLSSDVVSAILAYRAGSDGIQATADDKVFNTSQDAFDCVGSGTSAAQELNNLFAAGVLDTISRTFALHLDTKVLGKQAMEYDIIFDTQKVLRWQER